MLSFKNYTSLDWMGYSLDGQANKTILGNTTIPMPENGPHTIQVFGNDTLGNNYKSEVRHFTIYEPPINGDGDNGGNGGDDNGDKKRPPEIDFLLIVGTIFALSAIGVISVISAILIKKRLKR